MSVLPLLLAAAALTSTLALSTGRYKSMSHREAVDVLYKWCASDDSCSRAYQISGIGPWSENDGDSSSSSSDSGDDEDDEELDIGDEKTQHDRRHFVFLFSKWIEDFDQNDVDMCDFVERRFHFKHSNGNFNVRNSLRSHWISIMCNAAYNRRGHARCGVNKQLIVGETGEGQCICLPNRDCNDGGDWRPLINWETAIILAIILLSMSLCMTVYKNAKETHLYARLDAQCRARCGAREELELSNSKNK